MVVQNDGVVDVGLAMEEEKDENGQVDLEYASAAATVGVGFHLQDKSKAAMTRIIGTLADTEKVQIQTKEELYEQNKKLMVIDTTLNRVESTTSRLKTIGRKLRKSIQTDHLHCCLATCICINVVVLIILLFTTIGGEKRLQDIDDQIFD